MTWDIAVGSYHVKESLLQSIRSCLFCKTNFCTSGHTQLCLLCCVIQSDMWSVYQSLGHLFFYSIFPFQLCINFRDCLSCNRDQFPCNFLLLTWLSLWMQYPFIWLFVFRVFRYFHHLVEPGQILCLRFI